MNTPHRRPGSPAAQSPAPARVHPAPALFRAGLALSGLALSGLVLSGLALSGLAVAGAAPASATSSSADRSGDPASVLVLVNRDHPLEPVDYRPERLTPAGGSANLLVPEAAVALAVLLEDAAAAGHALVVESAYRSHERQAVLYEGYVQRYGEAYAARISAPPGTSEHQLGLAADVGLASGQCSLSRCFGSTPAGVWVAANAARHGFIVRYGEGQEEVTGYQYEPWHLRFVGVEAARDMERAGVATLEEYTRLLDGREGAGPWRSVPETTGWAPRWSAGYLFY
ncbi:MAG: M15 family metallopeptidase [Arthrobacter sp.]|uniref:M15 family metallopeptidase n=1 Tax=Arthrobacter sp. TaxID=1667 RepID=UPI003487C08B